MSSNEAFRLDESQSRPLSALIRPRRRPVLPGEWWFGVLLAAICLEGLGRKTFPWVPSAIFYFAKDAVLLSGLLMFRISPAVRKIVVFTFRLWVIPFTGAVVWSLLQLFNPAAGPILLGVLGLRAFWFWWLAPLVIASALHDTDRARLALVCVALIVSALAIVQFLSPHDAAVNSYATYQDEVMVDTAIVVGTGRARVASTFSFLSGFVAFVTLVPPILLAWGIDERDNSRRRLCLFAAFLTIVVAPMSGSRAPILLLGVTTGLILWRARVAATPAGRRLIGMCILVAIVAAWLLPEATRGVEERFGYNDTWSRILDPVRIIPTSSALDASFWGTGTGTQQNGRLAFGYNTPYDAESNLDRVFIEQGLVGYMLILMTKFGLIVGLWRLSSVLKARGQRVHSGVALAFAALVLPGSLEFDHVWQALFFTGVGLLLVDTVRRSPRPLNVARA